MFLYNSSIGLDKSLFCINGYLQSLNILRKIAKKLSLKNLTHTCKYNLKKEIHKNWFLKTLIQNRKKIKSIQKDRKLIEEQNCLSLFRWRPPLLKYNQIIFQVPNSTRTQFLFNVKVLTSFFRQVKDSM
jgi:hypothetical protein